ncbi:MAG TPA: hypothetical protein PKN50_06845 [Spirochaetota bacterium]|jgi:hypothetical protein|nr:hypothetical protein [Spirochaetota bacterium]HPV41906.1 hypothetical protein [Spirochaetota bacterium]
MKFIILIALFIAVQTSLFIHIYCLVGYISTKKMEYFRYFMITAVTNMLLSIALATIVMTDSKVLRGIRLDVIYVLEAGLIFIYMMTIKVRIIVIIIRRLRDPNNYHFSHFGKKIYNTSIVNFQEVATFFITFPFTLIAGAYFVVRVLRM